MVETDCGFSRITEKLLKTRETCNNLCTFRKSDEKITVLGEKQ
jgi:hypothetical protein